MSAVAVVNRKCHVKVGDLVVAISGKDKSKKGRIIAVSPLEGKALVSGVNIVKKHMKARKAGDESGIISVEAPIRTCKLKLVCPSCNSPTRIGRRMNSENKKVRYCKKCKKDIS